MHGRIALLRGRRSIESRRSERQMQMARHHVVGVFVDESDHVAEWRGLMGMEKRGMAFDLTPVRFEELGRQRTRAPASTLLAPELTPINIEETECVTLGAQDSARHRIAIAIGRETAFEHDPIALTIPVDDIERHTALKARAIAPGDTQAIVDAQLRQGGSDGNVDRAPVRRGRKLEARSIEIDEQCVRQDVVDAVGAAVEGAGVLLRQCEEARVEYEITFYLLEARLPKPLEEFPELLFDQIGVAVAAQQQVAPEHAILQGPERPRLSAPAIGRTESLQRRESGQHLERGRRRPQHVRVMREDRITVGKIANPDADLALRHIEGISDTSDTLGKRCLGSRIGHARGGAKHR